MGIGSLLVHADLAPSPFAAGAVHLLAHGRQLLRPPWIGGPTHPLYWHMLINSGLESTIKTLSLESEHGCSGGMEASGEELLKVATESEPKLVPINSTPIQTGHNRGRASRCRDRPHEGFVVRPKIRIHHLPRSHPWLESRGHQGDIYPGLKIPVRNKCGGGRKNIGNG